MSILRRIFDPIKWSTEFGGAFTAYRGFSVCMVELREGWTWTAFRNTMPAEPIYTPQYFFPTRAAAEKWAERWLRLITQDTRR